MLTRLLRPRADAVYVLLRVAFGLLFTFHGAQKLFGLFGGHQPPVGSQLWIGAVIEVACGLAVALGLWTSWAALLASGTMAVAYTQFHWRLQLGANLLPAVNKGELAVLYALVFLYIAFRGGGPWSLDALRGERARVAGGG